MKWIELLEGFIKKMCIRAGGNHVGWLKQLRRLRKKNHKEYTLGLFQLIYTGIGCAIFFDVALWFITNLSAECSISIIAQVILFIILLKSTISIIILKLMMFMKWKDLWKKAATSIEPRAHTPNCSLSHLTLPNPTATSITLLANTYPRYYIVCQHAMCHKPEPLSGDQKHLFREITSDVYILYM